MSRSLQNFELALMRLDEALAWAVNDATRDSVILRFELSFETAWKAAQQMVRDAGLQAAGPRASFEAAFTLGWMDDEVVWQDMIRARNSAVHTYNESFARKLRAEIPRYHDALRQLLDRMQEA